MLRALVVAVFGGILLFMLSVARKGDDSELAVFFVIALLVVALLLWPALRGYFIWPIRAQLLLSSRVLVTRSVFGSEKKTDLASIRGIRRTRFWHGGRADCDGVVIHLLNDRLIHLSSCNLADVDELFKMLLTLGIEEMGTPPGKAKP
ncbi:MAG: hypothetical protein JNM91_03860 [Flavobacteriales bacterium]|nr:hypothetical protein [Flavobacteriales bacterium]